MSSSSPSHFFCSFLSVSDVMESANEFYPPSIHRLLDLYCPSFYVYHISILICLGFLQRSGLDSRQLESLKANYCL